MAGHKMHPSILREYDIRGIVGDTLFAEDAEAIGRAFGTIVRRNGGQKVAVGYDGRLSSPDLVAAVMRGIVASGVDVAAVGLGPTPMLYFAVHHLGTDGGVQITGSHNPPTHNGFKMMLGKHSFFGEGIRQLGRMIEAGDFDTGKGRIEEVSVFDAYVARLAKDYQGTRQIHAVWDAGNGAAGPAMTALVAKLPGKHECLFAEVDGRFPNHHPDPTVPENLVDLIGRVKSSGAEIGIGFDGDGDRIGVVDSTGRIVWGDQILQILAADILPDLPGAAIIADIKSSKGLFDEITRLGGRPIMWKTGHSLIKDKMIEENAPLSGEMSGHIFYKHKFYGHDDALYVAVRLLDILSRSGRTLKEWRDAMPPVIATPEIRFDCADEVKFPAIQHVKKTLAAQGAKVNDIDGVRVDTDDGWWLLRASNTQAVLVARAEASSEDGLLRLKEAIRGALQGSGVEAPADF
ncbi:MAG TPA: phosphomannomutase/phosphoglucomutase [Geminicoccus sp.]|uniref:phosphoglucomutase/phosphomannomutase PgmG n=1 Tax=Geminicoccus sp. TaxID=2024832 RepID=UPI002E36BD4F|nr:phosphomannomutase/phosphoglucomutase [Geminicoccus sp.]HEX2529499.1 phosphomannomutase/phosphoglucomutase [Geminicoccus sp.]